MRSLTVTLPLPPGRNVDLDSLEDRPYNPAASRNDPRTWNAPTLQRKAA